MANVVIDLCVGGPLIGSILGFLTMDVWFKIRQVIPNLERMECFYFVLEMCKPSVRTIVNIHQRFLGWSALEGNLLGFQNHEYLDQNLTSDTKSGKATGIFLLWVRGGDCELPRCYPWRFLSFESSQTPCGCSAVVPTPRCAPCTLRNTEFPTSAGHPIKGTSIRNNNIIYYHLLKNFLMM
ncbi:hypothetical protein CEXT_812631 [Caerostris extrusa]|uniref:Uncharacterized protein n=1 Tax=Caerostris extrusa TaxID=172846 RepID=A0AAV4N5V3_CAEEX|nr:hypothetical protein CEXT_812631 [Caerostris extrusa]